MRLIASGFRLAEGPTLLDDAGLLVSDALGGGVRTLLPGGGEGRPLAEGRKGIGGIALDAAGHAIVTGRDVRGPTDGEDEVLLARPAG